MCARNKIKGLRNIIFTFLKIIEHWNMICFSFLFLLFNFYIYIFYLISMICISHLWTPYFSCVSPLNDDTRFLFGEIWFFEKYLKSPLILVFFLREYKIRKKTLCDSLFGKYVSAKIESGSEGQVTYLEGTVVSRNTLLNSYMYGLY